MLIFPYIIFFFSFWLASKTQKIIQLNVREIKTERGRASERVSKSHARPSPPGCSLARCLFNISRGGEQLGRTLLVPADSISETNRYSLSLASRAVFNIYPSQEAAAC